MGFTFKEGEYIVLCDDDMSDVDYAKGHLDAAAFAEGYRKESGVEVVPDFPVRHRYAAWLQTAQARAMGWAAEIRTYDEPAPGRFKVTEVRRDDLRPVEDLAEHNRL